MPETATVPPKSQASPFWKWLMRLTAIFALALFLVPTVYVVKYYAVDRPAEEAYSRQMSVCACSPLLIPIALPFWEEKARNVQSLDRTAALKAIGSILRVPGINYRRPLDCLMAKATLADVAAQAQDPAVRAVASDELGKVALTGAVIRR